MLAVTASTGVHHQRHGVVLFLALIGFESFQHHTGNPIRRVRPDIDNLIIALARRDHTLAVLFLHIGDFLFGTLDFLTFFLWNDHVINANGGSGLSGLAEAEFFEEVESRHGFFVAGKFITVGDEIADLAFAHFEIREAQFFGPNFAEDHPADCGFDDRAF